MRALNLALPPTAHPALAGVAREAATGGQPEEGPPHAVSTNTQRLLQLAARPVEVRVRVVAQGQVVILGDHPGHPVVLTFPTTTGLTRTCHDSERAELRPSRPCFEVLILDAPDGAMIAALSHELLVHVRRAALGLPDSHLTPDDEVSTEARQVEAEARVQALSTGAFSAEALARARACRDAFVEEELAAVPDRDRAAVAQRLRERFDPFDWASL
ncbi:MAG: hypothetical protein MUF10_10625 [Thermoanaerobaculaceae bacterium]|nr:hypothetical protein [Thermoanaerobaculaceae bacterium]